MPLPFFWICMGITTVTIGAIVAYEAHIRYLHFREQQEYERYARQYAENHPPPPPPPKQHEFKENDSDDDEDNENDMNNDNIVKHFVRDLNDNSELRRRVPRSKSPPPLTTSNDEHMASNRTVSDKSWVDDTEYELNEMEQNLARKKQYIEQQKELLDKAEMDLQRRWHLHQNRSSELLEQMSTSYYDNDHKQHDTSSHTPSTASSSFLSMNTSIQKSTDHELSKGNTSLLSVQSHASSSNDHVTSTFSTTNRSMNESTGRDTPTAQNVSSPEQSFTSFGSILPSSIDNNTTSSPSQEQQQQQSSDSSIGLNTESPWCFEEDDDDNDETALSLNFQHSMRLPISDSNIHPSSSSSASDSHHGSTDWDVHSLTNDIHSLSSHATSTDNETNLLLSPSVPSSSSSDGGSYDFLHVSDLDSRS